MKSLYKLLVERNVFICANFNEVVTAIDLEYFAESFNSLEVIAGTCGLYCLLYPQQSSTLSIDYIMTS